MLQSILNNLASFMEVNTGSFFKNVYPHVTIETIEDETYPVYWEDNAREGRPLLEDHLTNYAYIRIDGDIDLSPETSTVGRAFTYVATAPAKMIIHYSIPDNGEINYDVSTTFIQFLSAWNFVPGANSQIQYGKAQISSTNVNTIEVHADETSVEPKLRHDDRLVSIDFDLIFKFSSMTECVESDLCLGDLGTINQVSVGPLNVTTFGNAGCSHIVTKAEAVALKVAGTVAPACIYYLSDTDIYLLGITTTEFSIDGWLLESGEVDKIKYDFDNDNIFERRDKFNNVYRVSKAYIDIFGNPVSSFPWNNATYQGNTIIDSTFIHAGFGGPICLGNHVHNLSTLDVSGSTGTIQLNRITNFSTVTLSGAGTMTQIDAVSSSVVCSDGSLSTAKFDQGTFTNNRPGALIGISALSGSFLNITGGTDDHTSVAIEQGSVLNVQSSLPITGYYMSNSSSAITSNTGILNNVFVADSVFNLVANDTGAPTLTNINISGNSIFTIDDNGTALSNWTVSGRVVTLDVASEVYTYQTDTFITEIHSNVTIDKAVDGAGVVDLATQDNDFIGIIEITAAAVPFTQVTLPATWPERGRFRIIPQSAPSPLSITRAAPAAAIAGNFVSSKNEVLIFHSATVADALEIEVINGICQVLNVQNFL